jgi:hypothetical protein
MPLQKITYGTFAEARRAVEEVNALLEKTAFVRKLLRGDHRSYSQRNRAALRPVRNTEDWLWAWAS